MKYRSRALRSIRAAGSSPKWSLSAPTRSLLQVFVSKLLPLVHLSKNCSRCFTFFVQVNVRELFFSLSFTCTIARAIFQRFALPQVSFSVMILCATKKSQKAHCGSGNLWNSIILFFYLFSVSFNSPAQRAFLWYNQITHLRRIYHESKT